MAAAPPLPDLGVWADDFAAFVARFADLFARSEPRVRFARYLRGLLGGVERRNGWQLAEAMGEPNPRAAQRLLEAARWSAAEARDRLLDFCAEQFGDPDGVAVLDETGFLKKGDKSVGVARQYSGTAGRIENCQVGVFLGYASRHGHALVDRGLYLPASWAHDAERRRAARVPERVAFRTKPRLGRRLLAHALGRGLPVGWVTGDEVYGNDPGLRAWLRRRGLRSVLAVAGTHRVWARAPAWRVPRGRGRGRPPSRAVAVPPPVRADEVVASWPPGAWVRLEAYQGEKGPIAYEWAARRVLDKTGAWVWLLGRRAPDDPTELAYDFADAPADVPLATLARIASTRWSIEPCLLEAKDDVGLDQYEVRSWPGWYRYATLCLLAVAWVGSVRRRLAEDEARAGARGGGGKKAERAGARAVDGVRGAPPSLAGAGPAARHAGLPMGVDAMAPRAPRAGAPVPLSQAAPRAAAARSHRSTSLRQVSL